MKRKLLIFGIVGMILLTGLVTLSIGKENRDIMDTMPERSIQVLGEPFITFYAIMDTREYDNRVEVDVKWCGDNINSDWLNFWWKKSNSDPWHQVGNFAPPACYEKTLVYFKLDFNRTETIFLKVGDDTGHFSETVNLFVDIPKPFGLFTYYNNFPFFYKILNLQLFSKLFFNP